MTRRSRAEPYEDAALAQIPRLLSLLDREPLSRTFGSFDREHWGWKFRDYPLTMLQLGIIPLTMVWRTPFDGSPYQRNAQLHAWILGALDRLCDMQRRNGSFDSVGPFTQDHGVTLAAAYILAEAVLRLENTVPPDLRARVERAVAGACAFAARSDEDYAFISNHHALFAVAYQSAATLLQDPRLENRGERAIDGILRHQSEEGWYLEYGGPDPGYESLGIAYLAHYWTRAPSERLLESLRRSIDFYSHCVHPDGSVGGVYGSRATKLYFPSGFELLASEIPRAAAVALFLRSRLERHNVLTPASVDAHNLAPLLSSYLAAAAAPGASTPADGTDLPCESWCGTRYFADAALAVAAAPHYYALVGARAGGACLVFGRADSRIVYQDAGYVIGRGRLRWTSQAAGTARMGPEHGNEVACTTTLVEVRQELPTPGRFIVLRLLNLTLFRFLKLGSLIRRVLLGRLILRRAPGPFRLTRRVEFGPHGIRIRDRLEADRPGPLDLLKLPRRFTGIHMGSSKYHHGSDLDATLQPPIEPMIEPLARDGVAQLSFAIRFDGQQPELEVTHDGDGHRPESDG